jgi:hypothetical protein
MIQKWWPMDVPAKIEAAFPPAAELLLNCARRPIDDQMLMDIARAYSTTVTPV